MSFAIRKPVSDSQAILRLYRPGTTIEAISRTQDALYQLQRSEQGWAYAAAFVQSPQESVRFFGALTFTIKINQDWESLDGEPISDELAATLHQALLHWYSHAICVHDSNVVIHKLSSALAALFRRSRGVWGAILRHVYECLSNRPFGASIDTDEAFAALNPDLMTAMLDFVDTLVRDIAAADATDKQAWVVARVVSD